MLGTGPPLEDEWKGLRSVSPRRCHHGSRSSSPGIPITHVASRDLAALSLPPRPHTTPPSMDMAMKPACFLAFEVESPVRRKSFQAQQRPLDTSPAAPSQVPSPLPVVTNPAQLPEEDVPVAVNAPAPGVIERPGISSDDVPVTLPSIDALARLVKLEHYQTRRCHQLQQQLLDLQVLTARTARLAQTASSVLRILAECIRLEDKANFVNLFGAFQRALSDCVDSSANHQWDTWDRTDLFDPQESFLDTLTEGHRAAIVDFVTNVRYNGDFIADCIAALSQKEVLALLPNHGASKFPESVFSSSLGNYSRTSRHLGLSIDSHSDLLESQAFGSPLEALILATRGHGTDPKSEDDRALGVWSTVCSRLITEQKTGSEKLVPAVLDLWAASGSWPGKARLELWILQTLQAGSFLTEQPIKQTFRMRIQARPDPPFEDQARADRFYDNAVHGLLDLLADTTGASVIPEPVLHMSHAIWEKLSPSPTHQRGFPLFVVRRWIFSPYFSDAIALPEAFGMVEDHYISEHARQRILREVASRALKAIFDVVYSWKHGNMVSTDMALRVEALMKRLTPQSDPPVHHKPQQPPVVLPRSFVVLQPDDLIKMVRSLYPSRRPPSLSSDQETLHSGLHSSASSISGFSLFKDSDLSQSTVPVWHQASGGMPSWAFRPSSKPAVEPARYTPNPYFEDAEVLHQACRAVEEAQLSSSRWAVLMTCQDSQGLQTVAQAGMASPESSDRRRLFGPSFPSDRLASVLKQVITEGDILHLDKSPAVPLDIEQVGTYYSVLQHCLKGKITSARNNFDFVNAHAALRDLRALYDLCENGADLEKLRCAIHDVETRCHQSLIDSEVCMDTCEGWRRISVSSLHASSSQLRFEAALICQARDKMWYVADVRTSAAYDEARSVSSALRVMGKPKRTTKTRGVPPLRHWSTSKLTNNSLHLKSEAQILELLSAAPEHGGPNKLSDDQARSTSQWMVQNSIENLCRGEERLHRLCMEILKCANRLTGSDALFLATNPLFTLDPVEVKHPTSERVNEPWPTVRDTSNYLSKLTMRTDTVSSFENTFNISTHLSNMGSNEFLESRSPTLTHRSSLPFWSPAMTEDQSPSSATSIGSYRTQNASQSMPRKHSVVPSSRDDESRIERMRHCLIGMLLSDLATSMFSEGSETDIAFWGGLGGTLTEKHLRSLMSESTDTQNKVPYALPSIMPRFNFMEAFHSMLQSFAASSSPYKKLGLLYDIDRLLPHYLEEDAHGRRDYNTHRPAWSSHSMRPRHSASPKTDDKVTGFCRLFQDSSLRPRAIFRDLQYMAALVPSSILEDTPQGKAFWNAAVAISDLRQQARALMVETADSIIAYHSNNRGHGRSSSTAQQQRDSATFSPPSRSSSAEEAARYTMADAAYLLQITAKEGDPVAQRELATLYLTHPDLTNHIIAPFAQPRNVFKEELENKWRRNMDAEKCDPATMCVAHHWMSLSAKSGDALAATYLRQREEMDPLL